MRSGEKMDENRVIRVIKKISVDFFQDRKYYSTKLALYRTGETLFQTIRLRTVSHYFQTKKTTYVLDYLKTKYGYVFTKKIIEDKGDRETNISNKPIWICWLDGIENAPLLVQKCVSSIIKSAGDHPVKIITNDNYTEYITLPKYIIEKKEKGLIGGAHFSDILRVCLLAQYGGLWLDSTIYCKEELPNQYFEKEFFTCKSNPSDIGCVSRNEWTTFCLGGNKRCILFEVLKEFFFEYWKIEECAIDYLFFDDAIEIAREYLPEIDTLIKTVPNNNFDRDRLIMRFADPWKEGCIDDLITGSTVLFKLGYREKHFLNETTSKGEPTVYAAFLRDFNM